LPSALAARRGFYWLYQFVDSCRSSRPAPILLPAMAIEINGGARPPRLLDRVREANRLRHGSRSTEKSYVAWLRGYVLFHGKRPPAEMGAAEVAQFLSSLAVEGKVAASTQNQTLSALLFLYRHILHQDLPWLEDVVRAAPQALTGLLTRDEVRGRRLLASGARRVSWRRFYTAPVCACSNAPPEGAGCRLHDEPDRRPRWQGPRTE